MIFFDTKGREHKIDIRPSKWKTKELGGGRGQFQSEVGVVIREVYPNQLLLEEFPCLGESLFLDFLLPKMRLAVEVHGTQHYQFNSFFHKDRSDFLAQQKRDGIKAAWCEKNNITLCVIDYGTDKEKIKTLLSQVAL